MGNSIVTPNDWFWENYPEKEKPAYLSVDREKRVIYY
jgi:hypothetical protein